MTIEEMASLRRAESGVSDFVGLEALTALQELFLDNNISGLSAFAGLTSVTYLLRSDNSISDLSGFFGSSLLEWLGLVSNSSINCSEKASLAETLPSKRIDLPIRCAP